MDIKYADVKGIKPVFSSPDFFSFGKCSSGTYRLPADLKFKTASNKAIPKQQFRVHGLCDNWYIPP